MFYPNLEVVTHVAGGDHIPVEVLTDEICEYGTRAGNRDNLREHESRVSNRDDMGRSKALGGGAFFLLFFISLQKFLLHPVIESLGRKFERQQANESGLPASAELA